MFRKPVDPRGRLDPTDLEDPQAKTSRELSCRRTARTPREEEFVVLAAGQHEGIGIHADAPGRSVQTARSRDPVGFDPSDQLSTWLNFDYAWDDGNSEDEVETSDDSSWGIAAAARLAVNDATGISARLEYTNSNDEADFRNEIWGITATVDHMLTDNLMVRGEVRYDDSHTRGPYLCADGDSDQTVLLAELVYTF